MKGLRTFLYELKYAFLQMKRHIMLCFSAISAIGITLLLIGAVLRNLRHLIVLWI